MTYPVSEDIKHKLAHNMYIHLCYISISIWLFKRRPPRWRFYKYNTGDIFRAHTDGSWPGSGVLDGQLVHDMFGDRWSMLTWVLYLNDDFEGGGTRFMLPDGVFNQYTVHQVPATRGSVLCFYHGEHPLSPLHEGELVTIGTKYIIRSDVLYKL